MLAGIGLYLSGWRTHFWVRRANEIYEGHGLCGLVVYDILMHVGQDVDDGGFGRVVG